MAAQLMFDGATADGNSDEYPISGYDRVFVEVWSPDGATANVDLFVRADISGSQWFDLGLQTANPANNSPSYYSIAPAGVLRAVISGYASGTIFVSIERILASSR